jgi:hypothetical protein
MYIQSLTLHVDDDQKCYPGVITSKRELKAALSDFLSGVDVDFSAIGEQGIVLPLLIAEVQVSNGKIKVSYDLIDTESGLLTLFYQNSKGKIRKKEFGQVTRSELEEHIEQILALGKRAFIEQYFPPIVFLEKAANVMAISLFISGIFGVGSMFFFSELMWHDEVIDRMWPVVALVYLISGVMLLPKMLSKQTRERVRIMGQGLPKQIFSLAIGNLLLTLSLMLGGANVWHSLYAKSAQIDIVFSDKARDYYSKNCKGSVSIDKFSGSICLENKAYWQVIKQGTQAKATGQLSPIGFDFEAIELK